MLSSIDDTDFNLNQSGKLTHDETKQLQNKEMGKSNVALENESQEGKSVSGVGCKVVDGSVSKSNVFVQTEELLESKEPRNNTPGRKNPYNTKKQSTPKKDAAYYERKRSKRQAQKDKWIEINTRYRHSLMSPEELASQVDYTVLKSEEKAVREIEKHNACSTPSKRCWSDPSRTLAGQLSTKAETEGFVAKRKLSFSNICGDDFDKHINGLDLDTLCKKNRADGGEDGDKNTNCK